MKPSAPARQEGLDAQSNLTRTIALDKVSKEFNPAFWELNGLATRIARVRHASPFSIGE